MVGSGRPILWVGSSRRDLRGFPRDVRRDIGQALFTAQQGETDPSAKPLRVLAAALYLRLLRTKKAGLGERSTPSATRRPSMFCTPSRKNRKKVSPPRKGT